MTEATIRMMSEKTSVENGVYQETERFQEDMVALRTYLWYIGKSVDKVVRTAGRGIPPPL